MSHSPQLAQNGPVNPEDDDTFERDLKEMLKDGPSLNDLSSTVQGGNLNEASHQTGTGMLSHKQNSRILHTTATSIYTHKPEVFAYFEN